MKKDSGQWRTRATPETNTKTRSIVAGIGRLGKWLGVSFLVVGLGACGVPRGAGEMAQREQGRLLGLASAEMPAEAVRAELVRQAQQWQEYAVLVQKRELGGFGGTDGTWEGLVQQTAAVVRRHVELLERGQTDAATDREMLRRVRAMWGKQADYLLRP